MSNARPASVAMIQGSGEDLLKLAAAAKRVAALYEKKSELLSHSPKNPLSWIKVPEPTVYVVKK